MSNSHQSPGIIYPEKSPAKPITMPSSSFFGILLDGSAYRSIFYNMILFVVSIGLFVYTITMFSLSIGLAITLLGLPLAYVFLVSLPKLNVVQAGIIEGILDVEMPKSTFKVPNGSFLDRLVGLTKESEVIASLVVNILFFPLAILYFVLTITSITVSGSLMLVFLYPLVRFILFQSGVEYEDSLDQGVLEFVPEWILLGSVTVLGIFLFILSLHLVKFLAYTHAKMIHYMMK